MTYRRSVSHVLRSICTLNDGRRWPLRVTNGLPLFSSASSDTSFFLNDRRFFCTTSQALSPTPPSSSPPSSSTSSSSSFSPIPPLFSAPSSSSSSSPPSSALPPLSALEPHLLSLLKKKNKHAPPLAAANSAKSENGEGGGGESSGGESGGGALAACDLLCRAIESHMWKGSDGVIQVAVVGGGDGAVTTSSPQLFRFNITTSAAGLVLHALLLETEGEATDNCDATTMTRKGTFMGHQPQACLDAAARLISLLTAYQQWQQQNTNFSSATVAGEAAVGKKKKKGPTKLTSFIWDSKLASLIIRVHCAVAQQRAAKAIAAAAEGVGVNAAAAALLPSITEPLLEASSVVQWLINRKELRHRSLSAYLQCVCEITVALLTSAATVTTSSDTPHATNVAGAHALIQRQLLPAINASISNAVQHEIALDEADYTLILEAYAAITSSSAAPPLVSSGGGDGAADCCCLSPIPLTYLHHLLQLMQKDINGFSHTVVGPTRDNTSSDNSAPPLPVVADTRIFKALRLWAGPAVVKHAPLTVFEKGVGSELNPTNGCNSSNNGTSETETTVCTAAACGHCHALLTPHPYPSSLRQSLLSAMRTVVVPNATGARAAAHQTQKQQHNAAQTNAHMNSNNKSGKSGTNNTNGGGVAVDAVDRKVTKAVQAFEGFTRFIHTQTGFVPQQTPTTTMAMSNSSTTANLSSSQPSNINNTNTNNNGMNMLYIDGANVGYYGLSSWYGEAKRRKLMKTGIGNGNSGGSRPMSADAVAQYARQHPKEFVWDASKAFVDVPPSFELIDLVLKELRTNPSYGHYNFNKTRPLIFLHQRHAEAHNLLPGDEVILSRWRKEGIVYCSPAGLNDDLCWLYGCFYHTTPTDEVVSTRKNVFIVTNDLMRDHIFSLFSDKKAIAQFRDCSRISLTCAFDKQNRETTVKFGFPLPYAECIQFDVAKSSWHVPIRFKLPPPPSQSTVDARPDTPPSSSVDADDDAVMKSASASREGCGEGEEEEEDGIVDAECDAATTATTAVEEHNVEWLCIG